MIEQNLSISLAGTLGLDIGGTHRDLSSLGPLTQLAMAYLVLERPRPIPRIELAEILWGVDPPRTWQAALRGVIMRVRGVLAGLPATSLAGSSGLYRMQLPPETIVDVEAAAAALEAARAALRAGNAAGAIEGARRAARLSKQRFLPGASGTWVEHHRDALAELRLGALEALSCAAAETGDLPLALEAAEGAVALEPLRESAHLRVMAALAGAGNRAAALRAYERCRLTLAEELGVSPSAATEAAYLALLQDEDLIGVPPPAEGASLRRSRLPASGTSFVGRGEELVAVKQHVRVNRLVSLVGTGGVGKSRLALEAARDLSEDFPDGVHLVELAGLGAPDLVAQHVLSQVGTTGRAVRVPTESLVAQLVTKRLLLVLDNCEQFLEACGALVQVLLGACPRVHVLVTSRKPLGAQGEKVWPVHPLAAPEPDGTQDASALLAYEAVQLFVERAAARVGRFQFDDLTAGVVGGICHRLDGIPLAIELAAARANVLSVSEISARLDDRFRLLVGGPRTSHPRHQTLRAAIDWSYEALTASESSVLRQLSVFAGGFTLAAAETVCDEVGVDVLATLSALVDKSLVIADPARSQARYQLLETIREYAAARLAEHGQTAATYLRHLEWASRVGQDAERELSGAGQATWLAALDDEHDNLRAALDHAVGPALESSGATAKELGARLAIALLRYWELRGLLTEGRARIAVWAEAAGLPRALQAHALNTAGVLAELHGEVAEARQYFERSLAIRTALDDDLGVATTLHGLANLAIAEGRHDHARPRYELNLEMARGLGERRMVAASLMNLGVVEQAWFGSSEDPDSAARASVYYAESFEVYEQLGDRHGMALALFNRATLAMLSGNDSDELAFLERSLAIRRDLGDKAAMASLIRHLRNRAMRKGERSTARNLSEEWLDLERELDRKAGQVDALSCLGGVALAEGRHEEGARYFDQAVALQRQLSDSARLSGLLAAAGEAARRRGDCAAALRALQEAIDLATRAGYRPALTWASASLARLECARGDFPHAASLCSQALEDPVGRKDPRLLQVLANTLAGVALGASDHANAARLLGAAAALRLSLPSGADVPDAVADVQARERDHGAALAGLGGARYSATCDEGNRLRLPEIVTVLDEVAAAGCAGGSAWPVPR